MRTPIFSLLAMRGPALSPVKQNLFALLLVLAVVLCGGQARAEIDINVLSGNRLYDVLDLNPPPSEVDGHVRIWPHGASVLGSSETFSLREPGEYHFHSQSLVLKTLTVTDIVVAFYGYDMITDGVYSSPVLLSLCNTTYATTSFVVGDSTNDGYTELNLEFGMHIQSFGFAYIGLPVIPGELAEGILKIGNDSSWSHVGLITIGQGNGAGRLEIKGEVSGGLSGDHPNIFVGRNQISRGGWYESAAQLDVSGGTVFANELVVEGRAIGTGDVHASLVRVQNGGFAGFSNLDVPRLEVGYQGHGEATLGRTPGVVTVGDASGTSGKLTVGNNAEIGDPTSTYAYDRFFDVANNGGTGEVLVNGTATTPGSLLVHGLTELAAGYAGGTASLSVTDGGQFTGTSEIRAATYHNYDGAQSSATILVEGDRHRSLACCQQLDLVVWQLWPRRGRLRSPDGTGWRPTRYRRKNRDLHRTRWVRWAVYQHLLHPRHSGHRA